MTRTSEIVQAGDNVATLQKLEQLAKIYGRS